MAQAGTLFNDFRRFREAVLQRSEVRKILIDYWMGTQTHAWETAMASNSWKMLATGKTK